jgi:LAS superfamily LD-carboxypeptidase LdcB
MADSQFNSQKVLGLAGILTGVSIILLWSYYTYAITDRLQASEASLASTTASYTAIVNRNKESIAKLQKENKELFESLSETEKKRRRLERLANNQEEEIEDLTKLTTYDPELLKKYSKVYFLSENYVPAKLEYIDPKYVIDPSRNLQIHGDIAPFLDRLLRAAEDDNIPLRIASAYRSFDTQKDLKTGYRFTYGAGTANQFSAEQGYSEHQLGSTVDFTTATLKGTAVEFENTTAFKWLMDEAHEYGFILSYPRGNGYYTYEPWHWRFVGEDLADDLRDENKYFYQLDQREIDEYLIKIFD